MARSREIGWGSVNIGLYTWEKDLSCECIPSDTTTTTTSSTTTTTTTTINPLLACQENWETSYNSIFDSIAVVESDAIGSCEVFTLVNLSNQSNVIKRDASANILWETTVTAVGPCTNGYPPIKIVAAPDGSSYVLKKDALFKLDSSGALVWYKNYNIGTNNFVDFLSFALSTDGYLYVLGKRDTNVLLPPPSGQAEPFYCPTIGKFDASTGALVAEQTYYYSTFPDDDLNEPPTDIKIDGAGNIIFTHQNVPPTGWKTAVVKIDSSLALVWVRSLGFPTYGRKAVEIAIDGSNNILLASVNAYPASPGWSAVTKLTSLGALTWSVEVQKLGIGLEQLKSITTDSVGNVYVCGADTIGGTQSITKLTSAGALSYAMELTTPGPATLQIVDVTTNNTIAGEKLYASVVSNVTPPVAYQSELIKMDPSAFPVGTFGNFTYTNATASYSVGALSPTSVVSSINLLGDSILATIQGTCAGAGAPTTIASYTKTVI